MCGRLLNVVSNVCSSCLLLTSPSAFVYKIFKYSDLLYKIFSLPKILAEFSLFSSAPGDLEPDICIPPRYLQMHVVWLQPPVFFTFFTFFGRHVMCDDYTVKFLFRMFQFEKVFHNQVFVLVICKLHHQRAWGVVLTHSTQPEDVYQIFFADAYV